MIDLTLHKEQIEKNAKLCARKGILLPTFRQMADSKLIPPEIREELKNIDLNEVHSRNLFRVTWENEPTENGGTYGGVNWIELPRALTGVKARIIGLVGKWFPHGGP